MTLASWPFFYVSFWREVEGADISLTKSRRMITCRYDFVENISVDGVSQNILGSIKKWNYDVKLWYLGQQESPEQPLSSCHLSEVSVQNHSGQQRSLHVNQLAAILRQRWPFIPSSTIFGLRLRPAIIISIPANSSSTISVATIVGLLLLRPAIIISIPAISSSIISVPTTVSTVSTAVETTAIATSSKAAANITPETAHAGWRVRVAHAHLRVVLSVQKIHYIAQT